MTDLSSSLLNNVPVPSESAPAHGASAVKPAPVPKSVVTKAEEEEDYTIKCICGFRDDDGNTVFCDRCETWQHTECYYYEGGEVPDVSGIDHWCADCAPRALDAKGARERQNLHREQSDLGERKTKKPTTKSHSHKKRVKSSEPNTALTNGWFPDKDDHSGSVHDAGRISPRDQLPPAKKSKTSHKPSNSLNSPGAPWMNPATTEKRSGPASRIAHSPSKSLGKHSPYRYATNPYSHEFLHLYDNDPGDAAMQANLFNDISITRSLSLWTQDASSLAQATNGLSPQDIFHRCEQSLDSMSLPQLRKEHKQDGTPNNYGQHPKWIFLSVDNYVPKGSIVGELKGKIGDMRDYAQDPTNRWDYLRHPVPFVFFHPKLPIYIDTRHEGSTCRYLRRSCRPNLTMLTILENGSDYRFCFAAKDNLDAGSELTIGWTLDEHIRNFFHPRNNDEDAVDADEDYVAEWVGKVLADFGGCACNVPNECSLARYDRRSGASIGSTVNNTPFGSLGKGQNGCRRSPPSNDHTVHSRSTGTKHQDEPETEDNRSTSGSSRSKPHSRELTPTRQTSNDIGFVPGLELSDRDKKKIAAIEKNFEQREQDKIQTAHKRKKRHSNSSSANTPSVNVSKQLGNSYPFSQPDTPGIHSMLPSSSTGPSRRMPGPQGLKSANTSNLNSAKLNSRKKRHSQQNRPHEGNAGFRQNYVNSSVQTEPTRKHEWYSPTVAKSPRQPYISLTKRLLIRCRQDRIKLEQRMQAEASVTTNFRWDQPSPVNDIRDDHSVSTKATGLANHETKMQNVSNEPVGDTSLEPPAIKPRPPDNSLDLKTGGGTVTVLPPPTSSANGFPSPDPNPQPPVFQQPTVESTSSSLPISIPQSRTKGLSIIPTAIPPHPPFSVAVSNIVQPSPVKKKIKFEEYISQRVNKAEGSGSTEQAVGTSPVIQHGPLKPLGGVEGESKGIPLEGSTGVDSPNKGDRGPAQDHDDSVP
ncbi:MAG: hypothetical protein LQ351_003768 [Letrouitia transgressa]|nr:MAG: hypothetical protein LQ351_003768 [Letrouitia transgressa]